MLNKQMKNIDEAYGQDKVNLVFGALTTAFFLNKDNLAEDVGKNLLNAIASLQTQSDLNAANEILMALFEKDAAELVNILEDYLANDLEKSVSLLQNGLEFSEEDVLEK